MIPNQFILNQITLCNSESVKPKKQKIFFILGDSKREKIIKLSDECITGPKQVGNTLLGLSVVASGISLYSFATVTGVTIGISSARISLVYFVSKGLIKIFSKIMGKCFVRQE